MPACVADLNDCEIRVAREGRVLHASPGYALLRGKEMLLGTAARQQAHLQPRQVFSHFWSQLSQDPLPQSPGQARHHADLAYAHLLAIHELSGKPAQIVLAVPGSFSHAQLALLLGIARACPFKVIGLVDAAVAAASSGVAPGGYVFVDLQLHQTVLTALDIGPEVVRAGVETLDNGGLLAFHDAGASLIAETLIQQARFDPRHHAETEQSLYDQLPQCLTTLATRSESVIEIPFRDTRHQARLSRKSLDERFRDLINAASDRCGGRIPLLSHRAAALPGMRESLPDAFVMPADAVFAGCDTHRQLIAGSGPELNFITRLPAAATPTLVPAARNTVPGEETTFPSTPVTHVLHGHRAFPLAAEPVYLSARGHVNLSRHDASSCSVALNGNHARITPLSDITIYINGERLGNPRLLRAGDKVGFAGSDTVYSLISLAQADAT